MQTSLFFSFFFLFLRRVNLSFLFCIIERVGENMMTLDGYRWNQKSLDFLLIGSESTRWRIYWLSWRRKWQPHTIESWFNLQKVPTFRLGDHIAMVEMQLSNIYFVMLCYPVEDRTWKGMPSESFSYYLSLGSLWLCLFLFSKLFSKGLFCLINGFYLCVN